MANTTIKQICERTGLSKPTVAQILSSRGDKYKQETRDRVLAAAEELGYRPNSSARAVSIGRFGCLALLSSVNASNSPLSGGALNGIQDAMSEHDLHLTLTRMSDESLTDEEVVPKILRQSLADGLLINYQLKIPAGLTELIDRHAIPSIWLNTRHQDHDCVTIDDHEGARQATEYLLGLGHRRIAFAGHGTSHYSLGERHSGYIQAMNGAGLTSRYAYRHSGVKGWIEEANLLLSGQERPTAVITYDLFTARPILFTALSLGLRVPEDLSIITFAEYADEDVATGRMLTIFKLPTQALGRTAVEMLLEKIDHPNRNLPNRLIPMTLMEGETCGPAPE